MNIRLAEKKDLPTIVEILNQAIIAGFKTGDTEPFTVSDREQWFNDHSSNTYPIYVAEKDHRVIGYANVSPYRSGRKALRYTAEVSCFIHSDYQNKGVGSKLMRQIMDIAPSLQIKTLFAICFNINQGSIGLLKKHGFSEWGHLPCVADFNGTEVDHLYFGLRLVP